MPYNGQAAGKTGHDDLLRNPEIDRFLSNCDHMREPSEDEIRQILADFEPAPVAGGAGLPALVVANDGSRYESQCRKFYPSTRVGYVKISSVGVEVDVYARLVNSDTRLIDPFSMNWLQDNTTAISLALPSTNLRYGSDTNVVDGFRRRIDEIFRSDATETGSRGERLLDTLFDLAARSDRNGGRRDDGTPQLIVHRCPRCRKQNALVFTPSTSSLVCDGTADRECDATIFPTDVLRSHEAFTDLGGNEETLTRVMVAVEHILLAHYIRVAASENLAGLSDVCFMLDGPLAVFASRPGCTGRCYASSVTCERGSGK